MKKSVFIFIILLQITYVSFCQQKYLTERGKDYSRNILVIIHNGNALPIFCLGPIIGSSSIDSHSTIIVPDEVTKNYLGVDHALVFFLRPGTKLIHINTIYKIFNIPLSMQNLPVYVDNALEDNPQGIVATKQEIFSVRVKKLNDGKKCISILSVTEHERLKDFIKRDTIISIR